LRLQKYDITLKWVPGKLVKIADTLSRAPLQHQNLKDEELFKEEVDITINTIVASLPMNETRFIELKDITKTDPTFKQITDYVINIWPLTKSDVKMPTNLYL
jgi:hypothetical protein